MNLKKIRSRKLLIIALVYTLMGFCGVYATPPQVSREQIRRVNVLFCSAPLSWDEQKIKLFFELCFCNPENGEHVTFDELKSDLGRMSLLHRLLGYFKKNEFLLNRTLVNYVWEYGYMQIAKEFYVSSMAVQKREISLFDEFHFEAIKWDLEKLRGEKLRNRINLFLSEFASAHIRIGGINARNNHGNTLMYDAVKFLSIGGSDGIVNMEILNVFIECLLQRKINPTPFTDWYSDRTDVVAAYMNKINLPESVYRLVSVFYSFNDFCEEAKNWVDISDNKIVLKAEMNRFLDKFVSNHAGRGGINARDIFGNTILHIAIPVLSTGVHITSDGYTYYDGLNKLDILEDFIECLLERKIDIEICNCKKERAADIAKRYKISPALIF